MLLDGSLEVKSHPGEGSIFTLRLPPEGTPRSVDPAEFADENGVEKPAEEGSKKDPGTAAAKGVRVA
jgi:hypothetical protein